MRTLAEMMSLSHPFQPTLVSVPVTALLRRGRKSMLNPPCESLEMECQDCGGTQGYTCLDAGHRCWFCGNEKCLKVDAHLTKALARKARPPIYKEKR